MLKGEVGPREEILEFESQRAPLVPTGKTVQKKRAGRPGHGIERVSRASNGTRNKNI